MTVSEFIKNKEAHLSATLICCGEVKIILHDGNSYTEEAFNKKFHPHWRVESLAKNVKENSDKTKNWLNS